MDADEVWRHTHEQRRAALPRAPSEGEWAVPSLCEDWTVRDVSAHVMRSATVTPLEIAVAPAMVATRRSDRLGCLYTDAARRHHVEIRATDADFAVGSGPLVEGPIRPVLLSLTGRTAAALPGPSGPEVEHLI